MKERLDYYYDLSYDFYQRNWRRLKWHGRYYVLPAYKSLTGTSTAERFELLRMRLQEWPRARYVSIVVIALLATGMLSQLTSRQVPDSTVNTTPTQGKAISVAPQPESKPVGPALVQAAQTAPATPSAPPLLFGLGTEMDGVLRSRLYRDAPVNLLTSWFNDSGDLKFMRPWANDIIPQAYADGKSLHLVVWTNDKEIPFDTKYGPACGRGYPFSASFADDMKQLATTYKGSGILYVSMFTEFQTYPCKDNMWQGSENYYRALQDQYRLAQAIFHENAPNSQVSLTWGGWQAAWDDKARGGGRSLLPHFADVMRSSDFQSFQAMDSTSNFAHITDMTRLLHSYGSASIGNNKVMVAHFKPDNGSQSAWRNDLERIFTPENIAVLQKNGLFAFNFMDEKNLNASETAYQQARRVVQTYAR